MSDTKDNNVLGDIFVALVFVAGAFGIVCFIGLICGNVHFGSHDINNGRPKEFSFDNIAKLQDYVNEAEYELCVSKYYLRRWKEHARSLIGVPTEPESVVDPNGWTIVNVGE